MDSATFNQPERVSVRFFLGKIKKPDANAFRLIYPTNQRISFRSGAVQLDSLNVNQPNGGLLATGNLQLGEQLSPDQTLVYRSDSLTRPIIAVETQLAPGVPVPDSITAKLTFNGTAGTTYSYSTSGLATGQQMRFALQADGTSLATGMMTTRSRSPRPRRALSQNPKFDELNNPNLYDLHLLI